MGGPTDCVYTCVQDCKEAGSLLSRKSHRQLPRNSQPGSLCLIATPTQFVFPRVYLGEHCGERCGGPSTASDRTHPPAMRCLANQPRSRHRPGCCELGHSGSLILSSAAPPQPATLRSALLTVSTHTCMYTHACIPHSAACAPSPPPASLSLGGRRRRIPRPWVLRERIHQQQVGILTTCMHKPVMQDSYVLNMQSMQASIPSSLLHRHHGLLLDNALQERWTCGQVNVNQNTGQVPQVLVMFG